MKKLNKKSRRRFLQQLALASVGSGLIGTQGKMSLMQSAMAASGPYADLTDYKSLVCVYLFGGNDSFNMFMPHSTSGYQQYASVRGSLAIDQGLMHAVNGGDYGFHPSMPNIANLYNDGRLGVLANTGTLLQPTSRADIQNGTANLPPDLFSHSHQTEMWQTNKSPLAGITQDGWGGEMADLLFEANSNPIVPPTITMFGQNNWQAGEMTQQVAMNTNNGAEKFLFLSDQNWPPWESSRTQAWENMLERTYSNRMQSEVARGFSSAREQIAVLEDALTQAPAITTTYNNENFLAAQLKIVAEMIAVREYLGMKRQIFFVGIGNWDSHGNQLNDHAANLALLDDGLNSFNSNINELNKQDSVVSFTMSEFGRTLTVNGDGTDHAWGTHCLLMGGPVAGGQIHGQMPQLVLNGPDDADAYGHIIPTTSIDQYAATLGGWMGINPGDLAQIFPNLGNFGSADLGFLA